MVVVAEPLFGLPSQYIENNKNNRDQMRHVCFEGRDITYRLSFGFGEEWKGRVRWTLLIGMYENIYICGCMKVE